MTPQELAGQLLAGQECASCHAPLTPDAPCAQCGTIPEVTGPELRQALEAAPWTVAEVEASQAEADAYRLLDEAIGKFHSADVIRRMFALEMARDQAKARADAQEKAHEDLLASPELATARRRAERAAGKLEKAQADHKLVGAEAARAARYEKGLPAETDAELKLQAATRVLARYEAKAAKTTAALAPHLSRVTQSAATRDALHAAAGRAQAALENPGRIGYGAKAVANGMLRLLGAGRLDDGEKMIAGRIARQVSVLTGDIEDVERDARRALLAEQEGEKRKQPLMRQRTADGQIAAIANPRHAGNPQPYHPPAPVPQGGVVTAPPSAQLGEAGFPR